jgi:hypothetical protein
MRAASTLSPPRREAPSPSLATAPTTPLPSAHPAPAGSGTPSQVAARSRLALYAGSMWLGINFAVSPLPEIASCQEARMQEVNPSQVAHRRCSDGVVSNSDV